MRIGVTTAIVCVHVLVAASGALGEETERIELEPLTVIGTTPLPGLGQPLDRVPANVQQLSAEDAEALDPLNVPELLRRRATGFHLTQTQNSPYQADVVFRGFTSSFLLGTPQGLSVFQDGVRLNDFLGDAMNWDLVPESSFATLEIIPGANPVYGRNTLGGAIALETKSGRTHPGTFAEASAGSFGRWHTTAGHGGVFGADGEFDYLVLGDFGREDGFRDFSHGDVARLFGRAGWRGEETDAWLTYNLARNELRGNGFVPESLLREDRSAVFTHPDLFEPELDFVTGHLSRTFGPALRFDSALYFRRVDIAQFNADAAEEEDDDDDDDDDEDEDGDDEEEDDDDGPLPGVNNRTSIDQHRFGGTAQGTWQIAGAFGENALAVGFEGEAAAADVRLSEQPGFVNAQRTVIATGAPELATDVETSGTVFGIYATDTWTPLSWLSLTASLRYDRATIDIDNRLDPDAGGEHTFERVNPAAGVNVRAGERIDFYARYGESFRVPSAIELSCANEDDPCPLPVAFADDPPLEEVKARTWEVGLRARPVAGTRATLALFRTTLEDDILFVASSRAEGFFQNVDETRRIGLEAGLEGDAGPAEGFLSYALTKATFRSTTELPSAAGENVARPGDELPGVPQHLVKAGFGVRLPFSLRFDADAQYVSGQFLRGDEANERGRLDDYAVVNAGLSWTWRQVTLFARAENLFDFEYETFGTFGENALAGERVERFLSPGAPLGGWFGLRIDL